MTTSILLDPPKVWSRSEALVSGCVPRAAGVYAWYFKTLPPLVPDSGCWVRQGLTLLYVGIAPKEPPQNGRKPSSQTLARRIRYHLRGNAYGSTLRLTLGCLLAEQLGIELRRVGSGERVTFAEGESVLSEWMADNAFVCWVETPLPWELEAQLISATCLPLNLAQNRRHPFHATLSALRREHRQRARTLPVWRPTV
jgi:hypothetical protein